MNLEEDRSVVLAQVELRKRSRDTRVSLSPRLG